MLMSDVMISASGESNTTPWVGTEAGRCQVRAGLGSSNGRKREKHERKRTGKNHHFFDILWHKMDRHMTKPTKWHVRPAKTQISPSSLIRVFAVRMKKAWFLSYPLSAQWRLRSDWADAQAYLSLRWARSHFVGFVMRRLKWTLAKRVDPNQMLQNAVYDWGLPCIRYRNFKKNKNKLHQELECEIEMLMGKKGRIRKKEIGKKQVISRNNEKWS